MLEALILRYGYLAIVLGTFFEGETILIAAGAIAHRGLLELPWVVVAAFVGSLAGDQLWFLLGRRYGPRLLDRSDKWRARSVLAQRKLARYGTWFVFGFRFIYGVRTLTPVLLGATHYPLARFVPLNVLGAAVWALAFALGGWALGATFATLLQRAAHIEELLLGAAAIGVIAFLFWRMRQRARAQVRAVRVEDEGVAREGEEPLEAEGHAVSRHIAGDKPER